MRLNPPLALLKATSTEDQKQQAGAEQGVFSDTHNWLDNPIVKLTAEK